jgi:hypothetical protein
MRSSSRGDIGDRVEPGSDADRLYHLLADAKPRAQHRFG